MKKDKFTGYGGNILHVDLTRGTVKKIPITYELISNYIGGFGFTAKLVYDFISPGVDPLAPGNVLVIGAPLLGGTFIPTGGRTVVMGKSPVTGSLGISHMGEPGAMMKFAGYDQLVVTGKAAKPCYIKINNGEVSILDAKHLWGLTTYDTTDTLWRELGGEFYVSCIGPAGENLVRFANIITNKYSTAGRCGLGAVMGSKNLKAVAVFGDREIGVSHPGKFAQIAKDAFAKLMADPGLDRWRKLGSLYALPLQYRREDWRLRYHNDGTVVEPTEVFDVEQFIRRVRVRNVVCFACPIGCKQEIKIREGEFTGTNFAISCAMGTMVRPFSLQLAVDKYEDVAKCAQLNNSYGMDSHVIDHTIKLFIELQHEGVITPELTDGMTLEWGDKKTILELIRKTALREGVGNLLAEGAVRACKKLGVDPEEYVIHAKGIPITPLMDPRIDFGPKNLGAFVNPRRGHYDYHRAGMQIAYADNYSHEFLRKECRRLGVPPEEMDKVVTGEGYWGWNVSRFTRYVEDYSAITYCLGVCDNIFYTGAYDMQIYADLFSALTGIKMSVPELMRAGERIWNLQRMFNIREGDTRKDDQMPGVYTRKVLKCLGKEYPPFSAEEFNRVLDEYYSIRGWDSEGKPTGAKLAELNLSKL